ncbi:coagulation factor XI-like [Menidia menidia]
MLETGTCLVLLGLLSVSASPVSQGCQSGFLENVDFPGSDLSFLYSPDVEHCQLLCTQHPSCLFFTFIREDWTRDNRQFQCYLKSTLSGEPDSQIPLQGVTSGFSLKSCAPDTEPCLSKVYQNVDFPGADYKSLFTPDYEECQRVCTQDAACQFFTFLNENFIPYTSARFKCHLKFSWNVPRTPIVERKAGVTSGFSPKTMNTNFDDDCQNRLFPETGIPGSDLQMLKAASPEHCRFLCSAHPQCSYFSFSSNSLECFLKNNPNGMEFEAKEGGTSGMPARFCRPDENWMKVKYKDLDFLGSDVLYELMDGADACQQKCWEDPRCQFFTYVDENFFDRNTWRRCYLKRVITMPSPPKITKLANVVSGFTQRSCGGAGL